MRRSIREPDRVVRATGSIAAVVWLGTSSGPRLVVVERAAAAATPLEPENKAPVVAASGSAFMSVNARGPSSAAVDLFAGGAAYETAAALLGHHASDFDFDFGLGALATLDPTTAALEDAASAIDTASTVDPDAMESLPPGAIPAQPDGACPIGMVAVEGTSCHDVQHTCLREAKDDPARRCLEFKKGADVCLGPTKPMRFCMDRYEYPGVPGAKPRVMVNYFEAEALCKQEGKRICEEDEFYLACEGPEHWPYAWGHSRHPSTCNIDRPYVTVDWKKWASTRSAQEDEAKRLDQALPIGTSQCFSPYGIHDIAGNADEWTHAREGRELLGSLNGGYWGPVQNACRYVTTVHGPEFSFYQIGFRCCADAKAK